MMRRPRIGDIIALSSASILLAMAAVRGTAAPAPAPAPAPAEVECEAPAKWFAASGVAAPDDSTEPKRGDDCDFYQRAWQHFLYAVSGPQDNPAFLGPKYRSYNDEFGADPSAGLLAAPATSKLSHPMVLAPEVIKSGATTTTEDILQAQSNQVLIDQAGHPIFYSIFMNDAFAQEIEGRHYNQIDVLRHDPIAEVELPPGVVEFKAAWQIVDLANPPADRIVIDALVPTLIPNPDIPDTLKVDPDAGLHHAKVALIGLHVVFLPKDHPEMIWATFEYDRNAPSTAGQPTKTSDAAACRAEQRDDAVMDDGNSYQLYANGTAVSAANQRHNKYKVVDAATQVFEPKTSIVRVFPFSGCFPGSNPQHALTGIDDAIVSLNADVHRQLANPWLAHYQLVGAVWLDEPRSPHEELAFHSDRSFDDFQLGGENRLSSTSMESFTQHTNPNCLSCHTTEAKGGGLPPLRISVSHMFKRFSEQPQPISPTAARR